MLFSLVFRRKKLGGTVYVDEYGLPKPFPKTIRVTIEPGA